MKLSLVGSLFLVFLMAQAVSPAQKSPGLECKYENATFAKDVGKDNNTDEGHCSSQCYRYPLLISPSPVLGKVNMDVAINFRFEGRLGGENQLCASTGTVDWGDGQTTPMPADSWKDCDGNPSAILHDTVGKGPNYTLHHTYQTAGAYCVSASIWGNHKYHGAGSCSYDCFVSGNATVHIR